MEIWILFSLSVTVFGHIDLGTLGGFLRFSEVEARLQNLTATYPKLIFPITDSGFTSIVLKNSSASPTYTKQKVLITGGLSGGSPMSTYQVLQLADEIADQSSGQNLTITQLLNSYELHFIPVLNVAAYLLTEKNYTGGSLLQVMTDLSSKANCSGYDLGINPDHNFDSHFSTSNSNYSNPCSNDYSGPAPFSSNITSALYNYYFKTQKPYLVINYDGYGNAYKTPFSYSSTSFLGKWGMFYSILATYVPSGYSYQSHFNNSGSAEFGSLLDYAYDQSKISMEVSIGSSPAVNSSNIMALANQNYGFVLDLLYYALPDVEFEFVNTPTESVIATSGNVTTNYSLITFKITAQNFHVNDMNYDLLFTPGFTSSGYTFLNCTASYFTSWNNATTTFPAIQSLTANTSVTLKDTIPGYSTYIMNIVYSRASSKISSTYNATATFISDLSSVYVLPSIINYKGDFSPSSNDGDDQMKKGVLVGLVLLIILAVLVGIAAAVLHCTQKNHDFQQNFTQQPRLPFPSNNQA